MLDDILDRATTASDLRTLLDQAATLSDQLGECGDHRACDQARAVARAARRVAELAQLDADAPETFETERRQSPCDLYVLLRTAISMVSGAAPDTDYFVSVDRNAALCIDSVVLLRMLCTLIKRRVAPAGADRPRVTSIHVERYADQVVFRIADDGPPMPRQAMDALRAGHIHQLAAVDSPTAAARLAWLMGGKIVVSKTDAHGTVLQLRLPISARTARRVKVDGAPALPPDDASWMDQPCPG
ncbi:MAG: hypothetical protein AAGF36_09750 [Pseudomonadota bacterium]